MGPSKRKGSVRRPVLDLNSKEDSPSTWQTKYQNVLPEEEVHQNGDATTLSTPLHHNPLSKLLWSYNSDSDSEDTTQKPKTSLDAKVEDFLKEIQSISAGPQTEAKTTLQTLNPSLGTPWQQCYDHSSGYPYYWNTETNEVTWEIPPDLKVAIASVALKAQQGQLQSTKLHAEANKKVCKYPWQTESDSEDEKIEMITSFGPNSGGDSEEEKKTKKATAASSNMKSDCITLAPEDAEGLIENTYETSSLLTHGVQDTGPPGDECFQVQKSTKEDSQPKSVTQTDKSGIDSANRIADDVIAAIERETPPDYEKMAKAEKDCPPTSPVTQTTTGIALIANYADDDSEPDDNSVGERRKNSAETPIFPVEISQTTPLEKKKPLFPCMGAEPPKVKEAMPSSQEEPEPVVNIYNAELEDPVAQKAFKRKKRIEFATTIYGPSTSKASESKPESPERLVSVPPTQYNLDPNSNDRQGFGFNALKAPPESDKKYKNYTGGIQFVKAEIVNLSEPKPKSEIETENKGVPKTNSTDVLKVEEIEEAASLLREKVMFLTGGTEEISPIQQMAIELETLVLAWQQGSLTPPYLLRWLKEKCSELMRHEKTAAPVGWICLWDRKSKRYFYRNSTTKAIQWEYPNVEERLKGREDVEGVGDEMDICDTPPHSSSVGPEKEIGEMPTTPPPPVISDVTEDILPTSPTPQPPPPPQISFCPEKESLSIAKVVKKNKRKAEEMSGAIEEEATASLPLVTSNSEEVDAPPLPPMPPPPDESPPPLPDSPPPLPLESDQPLPPGVDEPEYTLYRTMKHSYKKAQPESAAYSAELMMTYGYGIPVQQVVSSNGQAMAMQMQSLDYHAYMHETVTTPYLVQSAPTSHVIHCPAKKPKPSLSAELASFYTDLAMLDHARESTGSNVPSATPALPQEPAPAQPVGPSPPATVSPKISPDISSTSGKLTEGVTSNGVNIKKKKKTKSGSGLSLKKKGVSSLVAKWQQVQQEVRKDFSDEDDDVPSGK